MTSPDIFALIGDQEIELIAAAIGSGSDANRIQGGPPGWRPLHAAIEELEYGGTVDVVILLLRHGADVDGWDRGQTATPLLMAFLRKQWTAVRILLAAGASADTVGSEGDTPLLCAVEYGDLKLLQLVLLSGPGRTLERSRGLDGLSPLGLAASRLSVDIVRLLLAAGANPNTLDADHRRALERLPKRTAENSATWDQISALLRPEPPARSTS
jgi:ankyrin repeat protein